MNQSNLGAQSNAEANLIRSTDFLISRSILNSVFHWVDGNIQATCFSVIYNGEKYLVTTKHNFTKNQNSNPCWINQNIKVKNGDSIQFQLKRNPISQTISGNVYFHPNEIVDIAIVKCKSELNGGIYIGKPQGQGGISMSQTAYFLGFPHGWGSESFLLNDGFPFPFIRKNIVSNVTMQDPMGNRLFLDGRNNSGFSGGPVLYLNIETNTVDLGGIVHGYLPFNQKAISKNGEELTYFENTGLVIAYDSHYLTEIIDQIPK